MRYWLLLLSALSVSAVMGQEYWGKRQGGSGTDETTAITTDAQGNVYTVGYFSLSASIGGTTLQSAGLTDIFLQKTSSNGSVAYTVRAGGPFSDRALGVATHADGSVWVCGYYTGSIDFGNGVSLSANAASQDVFLVRYNAQGQAQWAQSGGGTTNADRANAVAVDAEGNVFITGQYAGMSSFGGQTIVGNGNSGDIFIAKYSPQGNMLWIKAGVGTGSNRGLAITTDGAGACYLTGQFSNDIQFDQVYSNTIINALFVIKYNANGTQGWFRRAGGSSQSIGYGIASEGNNVYITGDCGPQLTFFNGPGFPVISNDHPSAVFLAAFSTSGEWLWGRSMGSHSAVSSRAMAVRGGEIALTGWFECTFDELSSQYGSGIFNNMGFRDLWVMRYNSSGNFTRAHHFASRYAATATGIALSLNLEDIVVGGFRSRIFTTIPSTTISYTGIDTPSGYYGGVNSFCGDNQYTAVAELYGSNNVDNLDGFTLKTLSPQRQPLDIFRRSLFTSCDRSIPPGQIAFVGGTLQMPPPDTISRCAPGSLRMTVGGWNDSDFSYGFSATWNGPGPVVNTSTSGLYSATAVSTDGCYTRTDTVYAILNPTVAKPPVSDSFGVNAMNSNPQTINICPGDTVAIWGHYADTLTYGWTGYGGGFEVVDDTVYVWSDANLTLTVQNIFGCQRNTQVTVNMLSVPPDTLAPYLQLLWNGQVLGADDTAFVCPQNRLQGRVMNAVTGTQLSSDYFFNWSITPNATGTGSNPRNFNITASDYYMVSVQVGFSSNACASADTIYTFSQLVYVEVVPPPQVSFAAQAPSQWCPGTPVTVAYTYQGELTIPSNVINLGDSLIFPGTGNFVFGVTMDYGIGCYVNHSTSVNIQSWPIPVAQTLPASGLICPDDSVWVYSNANAILQWYGPFGNLGSGNGVYADQPGPYFTTATYPNDCVLTSNSVEITGYATPYITTWPPALCTSGGSVTLTLVATHPESIVWFAPLSGDTTVQVVTEPGVYGAMVTACGYTSEVYITVGYSTEVISVDVLPGPYCQGDTAVVQASPGYENYEWNNGATGPILNATQSGTYIVAADDPFGCTILSQQVEIEFLPLPPAPEFSYDTPCIGDGFSVGSTPGYSTTWVVYGDTIGAAFWQTESLWEPVTIEAWLSSPFCAGPPALVEIAPKPRPEAPLGLSNAPVCTGSSVQLFVEVPEAGQVYHWLSPMGGYALGEAASFNSPTLDWEGDYLLWATLDGCAGDTASIFVWMHLTQQVELLGDTIVCENSGFTISTNIPFSTYLWSTGSNEPSIEVEESGQYWVSVSDSNGCPSYDETNVQLVNCKVIIPNVFTPNGDGMNDHWLITAELPQYFNIAVFDRNGRKVFESTDAARSWDGIDSSSSRPCSAGVYFYVAEIVSYDGVKTGQAGSITLVRN